jgi:hypothetical protein
MRVYLDDVRQTGARTRNPDIFTHRAYTASEAIELLETGMVEHISLDHDLGADGYVAEEVCGNGYQVACWIEQAVAEGRINMPTWEIHSMNPVGSANMRRALESAERIAAERV